MILCDDTLLGQILDFVTILGLKQQLDIDTLCLSYSEQEEFVILCDDTLLGQISTRGNTISCKNIGSIRRTCHRLLRK